MILHRELAYSDPVPCPYLPDKMFTQAYFFASEVDHDEAELLFSTGWRKFGYFFFRPVCVQCRMCISVRILVDQFKISKSQKRLLKKNSETRVIFGPLEYSDDIFAVYKDHSINRFGKQVDRDEFKTNFCSITCPSMLSKYYVCEELAGVGFLDISKNGLSSVYFVFMKQFQHLGLGNFSVLKEMQYCRQVGLNYYYLGYYVRGNTIMEYKSHFYPYERYNWNLEMWEPVEKGATEEFKEMV
jgi:arginine-tRNA-protein transferase